MTSLLKTVSILIGIMDMIIATLIGIGVMIFGGFFIESFDDGSLHIRVLAIFILLIIICFCVFYLGLLLKQGSEEEDLSKCLLWLNVRLCYFITNLVEVAIIVPLLRPRHIPLGESSSDPLVYVQLIGLLYQIFCILVVSRFTEELKAAGESLGKPNNLNNGNVFTIA